jgi:TRAP-type C4-dicarboxylate transport system permease small subunit
MRPAQNRGPVRLLEAGACIALVLMMLLVLVDVIGRNLLNRPVPWSTEVLEIIVGAMVFLLYPVLALEGSHITVDLIQVRPALRRVQRLLAAVVGAVLFAIIAWCMGRQAMRALGYGEASPILGIPLGWVLAVMSVLAGVCALAFVISAQRTLRRHEEVPAQLAGNEVI